MKSKSIISTPADNFPDIVGQRAAKSILGSMLRTYDITSIFRPTILVAPKGDGKSSLAFSLAKQLKSPSDKSKIKNLIEINAATIKNLKRFCGVIKKKVVDKEVTVFIDEASEIPRDVSFALLTVTNTQNVVNTLEVEDYKLDFDFRKITWLLATTEIQKVFDPLLTRFERIDLASYNSDELSEIARRGARPYKIDDGAMWFMSSSFRGIGRQAYKMGEKAKDFLIQKSRKVFTVDDWNEMRNELYIMPLGLSPIEINILEILNAHGPCSLTSLAASSEMSAESLKRSVELYLHKRHLIGIDTKGRFITQVGKDVLREVRAVGVEQSLAA